MRESVRGRRTEFGSFIVDAQGTILGFDDGMEQLTGWPAVELVGRSKESRAVPAVDEGGPEPGLFPIYEGEIPMVPGAKRLQLSIHCRDGRRLQTEAVVNRMAGPNRRALVTVLRVLARSAAAATRGGGERYDALTGLPTRDLFHWQLSDDLQAATRAARPMALIVADVDHLRQVNDRYGRAAGDQVLKLLGGILRVSVDDENRLFRLGEDDFAILLCNAGRGDARQLAACLRSTVERFGFCENADHQPIRVTMSLGAACFPTDADNEMELIERALEARDEAREMGRNRVWCYLRRPRVPVEVPVYFDGVEAQLVGYSRDLSPSGIFVQTAVPIDLGMRCALTFGLPGQKSQVHVIGRVVRTVPPELSPESHDLRIPGMGVEFERFGGREDQYAIDTFLHHRETTSLRPESGLLSLG